MKTTVKASVETNGFAIIEGFIRSRRISELLQSLESSRLRRSRAGIRHALRHPAFAELAADRVLVDVASGVLGVKAIPYHATLFDKSCDANWLVVWHQDTVLPLKKKIETPGWGPWSLKDGVIYAHAPAEALNQVVALRVHLDESSADNGPLRVLPGTHRLGILTDAQVERLVGNSAATTCTVPAGGILVMRPLLVHSSSKSHSSPPRRVLHVEYASSLSFGKGLDLAVDHETR